MRKVFMLSSPVLPLIMLLFKTIILTALLFTCLPAAQKTTHYSESGKKHHASFDREVLLKDDEILSSVEQMTSEEQKERLKLLVKEKIDANHDGLVDRRELAEWALHAFNLFETEDTRSEFPFVDKDGNGGVSWREYVGNSYGEDFEEDSEEFKNPDNKEWESFVQSYNQDKEIFQVADRDGNGELKLEEYIAFRHPRFYNETKSVFIKNILEKVDRNADGKVGLDEFLAEYERTTNSDDYDPDWKLVESDRFNEELDLDHDKYLIGDEIVNWMASDNIEESEEEASHIISECDADGDEKLSLEEILNNKDLWLESDVTDYGQMLKHEEL